MPTETNAPVNLRIELPADTVTKYERQAKTREKPLESVLSAQLRRFEDVDSTKPLILTDIARQHLDKLLARNLHTPDELVLVIQRALSVRLNGVEITLTPYLLDRLKSRCIGMEFDKFVQMIVTRLLEEYAGVR
jgi:hypothetical protein